jgi:hypothetical protein
MGLRPKGASGRDSGQGVAVNQQPELPLGRVRPPPDRGRCLEDLDGDQCDQDATPHAWHRTVTPRGLVAWRTVGARLVVWR